MTVEGRECMHSLPFSLVAGARPPCQRSRQEWSPPVADQWTPAANVTEVGADRLLFRTELMLQYALLARYKIDYGNLPEKDSQRIYANDLTGLLP